MGKARKVKAAKKGKVAGPSRIRNTAGKFAGAVVDTVTGKSGKGKKGTGKRRRRGPEYWAKKVLVERLKKKYWRAKYGGR